MRLLSFLKKPIITYQTIDRHDLPANKHHTTEQDPDQYTKYSKSLELDVVATEKKEGENLPSLFGKKNSKANSRSRLVAVSISLEKKRSCSEYPCRSKDYRNVYVAFAVANRKKKKSLSPSYSNHRHRHRRLQYSVLPFWPAEQILKER